VNQDIAIRVSNVSKKYIIGKQKNSSLRGSLAGIFNRKATQGDEFMALSDVSFDIKKGEAIGIIGKNGAGKSTLLKILSQITKPSEGRIEMNGRVASLLEVGTGFHPELTGRENIYLNGTILGMTRKEVKAKFDEIVAFSGVEKFIDTPVKHYSSGMYVRLAFAVAAHLEPEILIIDEVLAVGDAEFQKKCMGKMKEVSGHGRTVLFVSHNLTAVKELCNCVIYLKNGEIAYIGETKAALKAYKENSKQNETLNFSLSNAPGNELIKILELSAEPLNNGESITISSGTFIKLRFFNYHVGINLAVSLFILNDEDQIISEIGSIISKNEDSTLGEYVIEVPIPANILNSGEYYLNVVFAENQRYILLEIDQIYSFEVESEALGSTFNKLPGVLALSGYATTKPINR
jgi:lipopolysaccharide transport system ATP-binding protein